MNMNKRSNVFSFFSLLEEEKKAFSEQSTSWAYGRVGDFILEPFPIRRVQNASTGGAMLAA